MSDYQPQAAHIELLKVTLPNTERFLTLPETAVYDLRLSARSTDCAIRLAFTSGVVSTGAGAFYRLKAGEVYIQETFSWTGQRKVYCGIATGLASQTIQLVYHT